MTDPPTLRTENLQKKFRHVNAVKGVSIKVSGGEIGGLLGPNGAGKTTSFRMIVGLLRPDQGSIYLNGQDVTKLPMYRRARLGMAYLPQETSIFQRMTVEENLRAIAETKGWSKKEQTERVEHLMNELGIARLARSRGYALSGGERRRTEIARALIAQPKFFLLDEPFAGIDPIAIEDLQGIVTSLRDKGIGVLITDHNVRETLRITNHAYIINEGQVIRAGTPEEIAADPRVREVYLGGRFELDTDLI